MHLPGSSGPVKIIYLNQIILSSLCQWIPIGLDSVDLIMGDQSWMASVDSDEPHRTLGVRKDADLVIHAQNWKIYATPHKQPIVQSG